MSHRFFVLLLGVLLLSPSGVYAQEDTIAVINTDDIAVSTVDTEEETVEAISVEEDVLEAITTDEDDPLLLDGIRVSTQTAVPSKLGLFFRNIRERVTIGLTSDPVKKAEKEIKFAEERMQLATLMEDDRLREVMLEKADAFAQKAEARAEALVDNVSEEKLARVMHNMSAHHLRRSAVMDRIEEKLTPEQMLRFEEKREALEARTKAVFADMETDRMPKVVQAKLRLAADRVEKQGALRDQYQDKKAQLLDQYANNPEAAQAALDNLRTQHQGKWTALKETWKEKKAVVQERQEQRQDNREVRQDTVQAAVQQLMSGDTQNAEALLDNLRAQAAASGIDLDALQANGEGLALDQKLQGLVQQRIAKEQAKLEAKADGIAQDIQAEVQRRVEERIEQELQAQKEALKARAKALPGDALQAAREAAREAIGNSIE